MLRVSPFEAPSCEASTSAWVSCLVAIRPPRSSALPTYLLTHAFSANRLGPGRLQGRDQRGGVERALVHAPADEEAGRAGHATGQAAVEVALHPRQVSLGI